MAQKWPKMAQNYPKWPKNDARICALFPQFFFYWKSGSANFFAFRMYGWNPPPGIPWPAAPPWGQARDLPGLKDLTSNIYLGWEKNLPGLRKSTQIWENPSETLSCNLANEKCQKPKASGVPSLVLVTSWVENRSQLATGANGMFMRSFCLTCWVWSKHTSD